MIEKRIKELREKAGLTQKELAEKIGLTDAAIGLYEMGKRNPSLEILNRLADFFDVSIDYLLGRTDIPNLYKEKEKIENFKKQMSKYFTISELEEFIRSKRENEG